MATHQGGLAPGVAPPAERAPGHVRLRQGQLSVVDIATSTMANVGPAFSFYFGFAGIVAVSGIASPLTVLVAAVAIAFLGNTLARFSQEMPSTGSFVSFIGRSLGPVAGVTAGVTLAEGLDLLDGAFDSAVRAAWRQQRLTRAAAAPRPPGVHARSRWDGCRGGHSRQGCTAAGPTR